MRPQFRCRQRLSRLSAWQRRGWSTAPTEARSSVDGGGAVAVVFGGFGFRQRQMRKHEELYTTHGFDVIPIFSSISEMTTPAIGERRARGFAEELMRRDQPVVLHTISGSFWTMLYTLHMLDPEWREERVRAVAFDSCPPKSDVYAFGGWLAFLAGRPELRPLLAQLFHPYRWYAGINAAFEEETRRRMFGEGCLVPRRAHCLFMHGRRDPVLDNEYLRDFIEEVRARAAPEARVTEVLFERARHSMAVVEHPLEYKAAHIDGLLAAVPEWCVGGAPVAATAAARAVAAADDACEEGDVNVHDAAAGLFARGGPTFVVA